MPLLEHMQLKNRDLRKNKNKPMMNFNKTNSEECKYYNMNLNRRENVQRKMIIQRMIIIADNIGENVSYEK